MCLGFGSGEFTGFFASHSQWTRFSTNKLLRSRPTFKSGTSFIHSTFPGPIRCRLELGARTDMPSFLDKVYSPFSCSMNTHILPRVHTSLQSLPLLFLPFDGCPWQASQLPHSHSFILEPPFVLCVLFVRDLFSSLPRPRTTITSITGITGITSHQP